ncbi:MAG TPA: hypothetical protein VNA19_17440 [Pyrinomonadaceae bacterium]|jgi:hypothetical protein|nr:hypothetical protein [Pyrinomonadaceae bacterium]
MKHIRRTLIGFTILCLLSASHAAPASAQDAAVVLADADLARVVPPGFYYEGLSAPTQVRNSAAARFGKKHLVIVGMVDTSGYSTDVQAKYQGFFITDAPIAFQDGSVLGIGAYGFGFVGERLNILDVAGNQVMSVPATTDRTMQRPRPLMMSTTPAMKEFVRLYAGRNFVEFKQHIAADL